MSSLHEKLFKVQNSNVFGAPKKLFNSWSSGAIFLQLTLLFSNVYKCWSKIMSTLLRFYIHQRHGSQCKQWHNWCTHCSMPLRSSTNIRCNASDVHTRAFLYVIAKVVMRVTYVSLELNEDYEHSASRVESRTTRVKDFMPLRVCFSLVFNF